MNPVNRARVILALKVLAVFTFIAYPFDYLLSDDDFSFWAFLLVTLTGAVLAIVELAAVIIVEAAHKYITSIDHDDPEEE